MSTQPFKLSSFIRTWHWCRQLQKAVCAHKKLRDQTNQKGFNTSVGDIFSMDNYCTLAWHHLDSEQFFKQDYTSHWKKFVRLHLNIVPVTSKFIWQSQVEEKLTSIAQIFSLINLQNAILLLPLGHQEWFKQSFPSTVFSRPCFTLSLGKLCDVESRKGGTTVLSLCQNRVVCTLLNNLNAVDVRGDGIS